jgi:predicted aspartyl protease
METASMGRVLVTAKIENLKDLYKLSEGSITSDQVRRVEVTDALVDTGATMLSMPGCLIQQLGLTLLRERKARTSAGTAPVRVFGTVRLTIQGRDCPSDVTELPDDCAVLIGQVPLELLDFVVDSAGRKLTGNPEHGGEHILELYGVHQGRQALPNRDADGTVLSGMECCELTRGEAFPVQGEARVGPEAR